MESSFNLSQYEKIEKIGEGASAKVWKVKNVETKKIFAAKIFRSFIKDESEYNISRELKILPSLDHPSVLKFYGISETDFKKQVNPVIITEYYQNGSLKDMLVIEKKGRSPKEWDLTRKLITIYGIASALCYLHKNNIVHRDLKPANILMDDFLFPKVSDFGLSKIYHNERSLFTDSFSGIKGTPLYMAPEILEANKYSEKSDVYSFSIILYELITLNEPFKNNNANQIMYAVGNGKRPSINYVPSDSYKDLIEACWCQIPEQRPTFAEILQKLENAKENGFITDDIDEDSYFQYVNYIKTAETSFKKDPLTSFRSIKIEKQKDHNFIYPFEDFIKLNESCKSIVREAENDQEKQYLIGKNLIEGLNDFPKNTEYGIKYLKSSKKKGCLKAITYLSRLYIEGKVVPRDFKKAKNYLSDKLDSKESTVYLLYGKILRKEKNYEEALKYFDKASKKGNGEAMYECGKMYYNGEGCKKDEKEAQKYFDMSKANKCDKSDAFINKKLREKEENEDSIEFESYSISKESEDIDSLFENGIKFFESDKEKAAEFLKIAADKGHTEAMDRYGVMLAEGDGIPVDKESAIKYFKMAADEGNDNAMNHYAWMLLKQEGKNEEEDFFVDHDKINDYIKNAVEKGNLKAIYNLAIQYIKGNGFPVDKEKGLQLFKQAADKGYVDAMFNYAFLLCKGDVNKNEEEEDNEEEDTKDDLLADQYKEAAQYFKMAADKNDTDSMYCYAKMLENGLGVDENKIEAFEYYKNASSNGHVDSMYCCARMLEDGDGVEVDNGKADEFRNMARDFIAKNSMIK